MVKLSFERIASRILADDALSIRCKSDHLGDIKRVVLGEL